MENNFEGNKPKCKDEKCKDFTPFYRKEEGDDFKEEGNESKEVIEVKFNIVRDIVALKDEIREYNKLKNNKEVKEQKEILGKKLDLIKRYFESVIESTRQYLYQKNKLENETSSIFNSDIKINEIKNRFMQELENVDTNVLSICLLEELFDIDGLESIKTFVKGDNLKIDQFDARLEDVTNLRNKLDKHGTTEYIEHKGNENGPVLVVFPEIHNHERILKDNYNALKSTFNFYNFVATEGGGYDDVEEDVDAVRELFEMFGNISYEEFVLKKMGDSFNISSYALEFVLGEGIKTIGVENKDFEELLLTIQNKNKDIDITNVDDFNGTYLQYSSLHEGVPIKDSELFRYSNVAIKYRNYFWLKNIKENLIKQQKEGNSQGKNIVPVVCGAAHMDDLVKQSKEMGFKGVVKFTGKTWHEPYNKQEMEKIVTKYSEQQGIGKRSSNSGTSTNVETMGN